jgi:hypothetical protein
MPSSFTSTLKVTRESNLEFTIVSPQSSVDILQGGRRINFRFLSQSEEARNSQQHRMYRTRRTVMGTVIETQLLVNSSKHYKRTEIQ